MRSVLIAGALSVVVAACGDSADLSGGVSTAVSSTSSPASDTTTAPDATTTTGAPTTTAAATTIPATTAAPTTTAAPATTLDPSICPNGPSIPNGSSVLTTIAEDLDGDGFDELLSTYFVPSDDKWHFRVEFATGGSSDVLIEDSDAVFAAMPLGIFDIESDGSPEIFVQVGGGPGVALVGFFDVDGCSITRIGGDIATLSVGMTAGASSGISCAGDGFVIAEFATFLAEDEWEAGFAPYALSGAEFTAFPGDGGGVDDAGAAALAAIKCGDIGL